jgi:predicted amidohydrolase YtcJ
MVMLGGELITADPQRPRASAIAIQGDRIVYVGDDETARSWVGPHTQVVALEGRSATPGLVDAHCHLYGLGVAREVIALRGTASQAEVAARVAERAATQPEGEWVIGRGWDQTLWPENAFPTHASLDAVSAGHPVALQRVDGHALWVNAIALQRAGIRKDTPEPAGGRIVRDERGEPTGVLVDSAMALVEARIPSPSAAVIERRIRDAAAFASANGLTGVHEMGVPEPVIEVYRKLEAAGELPLRVYAMLSGSKEAIASLERRAKPEVQVPSDRRFVVRGIKLYADGALGSRGAALLHPYQDAPELKGNWVLDPDALKQLVESATAHGYQLAVHAIGDAGNRAVLDAFATALEKRPNADLRFRVEHAQVLAPEDLPRFAKLGVIASMQPTHATSDMRWAEERLGHERTRGAYAWRTLLDAGTHVAAGSDFPVEEVSPLLGLYAAVTRQNAEGMPQSGWFPEQRMTLDEAVRAFTHEAAYAEFAEQQRGMLRAGYTADLTVFDRPLRADRSLLDTQIDRTIVSGKTSYSRAGAP